MSQAIDNKTEEKKPEQLLIDLTNARHATALDASSILHRMQIEAFLERVSEVVGRVEGFSEKLKQCGDGRTRSVSYERYHDVITLHGKRGSGKTTFLLSALELLQNPAKRKAAFPKRFDNKADDDGLNGLCVLEILDPTLFGLHEHLLLSLLAKIAFEVRSAVKHSQRNLCGGHDSNCCLEDWEKHLRQFAKALKHMGETRDDLDGDTPKETVQWDDAEFIFEQNMESAKRSFGLEREFHKFLHESLHLIGKKAFVLALDDIDTRPQIGWHVLEVLRRYFTSPQLVVVLSGDMDLFKTIIEKQQLKIFDLNFDSDAEVRKEFKSRVDGLTEQYLLKILRTPSRINLGSFYSAIKEWESNSKDKIVEVQKNGVLCEMGRLLDITLFQLLSCRDGEAELYRRALFANPARTVTQVIDALLESVSGISDGGVIGEGTTENVQFMKVDFEKILSRFREVFFISVQNLGFERPYDLAVVLQTPQGINLFMEKFFERGNIASGIDLLPTRKNADENNGLLALCAEMTQAMHNCPEVFMAYLFKACLLREILMAQDSVMDRSKFYSIWTFLGGDSDVLPSHFSARISALHIGDPANAPIRNCGEIQLYSATFSKNTPNALNAMYGTRDGSGKIPEALTIFRKITSEITDTAVKNRKLKVLINSPESLTSAITSWQQILSGAGIIDIKRQGSTYRYFSIFSFISILGNVVECDNEKIAITLCQLGQVINTSAFKASGSSTMESNDLDEVIGQNGRDNVNTLSSPAFKRLIGKIKDWKKLILTTTEKIKSPVLLSTKIMERFFASLKSIDSAYSNGEVYLGSYINRCLVAFFNSILVEEFQLSSSRVDNARSAIFFKNVITDDTVFLAHLKEAGVIDWEVTTLMDVFPLLGTVLSFPLWCEYLDPDGEAYKKDDNAEINVFSLVKRMCNLEDSNDCFEVAYVDCATKFKNLCPLLNSMARVKKKKDI